MFNAVLEDTKFIARNIIAKIMFVPGPRADIFPFLLFPIGPAIMTAPGAANINPKKDISNAMNNILSKDLNSAKHP